MFEKNNKTTTIQFRATESEKQKLKEVAKQKNCSISDFVKSSIKKSLDQEDKEVEMAEEYQEQIKKYEDIKKRAIESLEKAKKIEGIQKENLELWENLILECDKSIENVKELDAMWKDYYK